MPAMGETRIGSYVVTRELGRGGMGVVYEAMNESLRRRAAIKILNPMLSQNADMVTRFFNEARAANIIDHPGIVEIYEFGHLPDGSAYFVMEFLKGESLGSRMRRIGRPLGAASLHLCHQIASVLAAAHDKHIVHRDMKPDNVMLVPDAASVGGERIKVLDFGIAKLAAEHDAPAMHTASGVMMGTPTYMSPEQCRGAGKVDERADVYSLGVMLYQMVCGQLPFIAEGSGVQIAMHLFNAPRPIREIDPAIPAELAELVHAMLAKTAAERPSMAEVAGRLATMMRASLQWSPAAPGATPRAGGQPGPLSAPSTLGQATGQRQRTAIRRPRTSVLAGAVTLAVLVVGAAVIKMIDIRRHASDSVRAAVASPVTSATPGGEGTPGRVPAAVSSVATPSVATSPPANPSPDAPLVAAPAIAAPAKEPKGDRHNLRTKRVASGSQRHPAPPKAQAAGPAAGATKMEPVPPPPPKPTPSLNQEVIKAFQ